MMFIMRLISLLTALLFVACGGPETEKTLVPPPAEDLMGISPLKDFNDADTIVEVWIIAEPAGVDLGSGSPLTMFAYNGMVPGPTLEANVGDEVIVHFVNRLDQPTTIHWHGLRIPSAMDGTPRVQDPVKPGETFTYTFTVPEAGSYWYHPHVRAHEQVERGLYGTITLRADDEPIYDAERTIVLDDILLSGGAIAPPFENHMEAMHGRFGNYLLTNGRFSSKAKSTAVEGEVERWRIVNTANARTMYLSVIGAAMRIIATDGGLLPTPYTTDLLEVAVGQRYDFEISYDSPGIVELRSHVLSQDNAGNLVDVPMTVYEVAVSTTGVSPRTVPLPTVTLPQNRAVTQNVAMVFDAVNTAGGGIEWRINGVANRTEPLMIIPEGSTIEITLANNLGPEHPFHLHGQFFEILDAAQPGLKDTVLVPGMSSVKIKAYMDNPGRWMAHCHILEHAELGMMAEILVAATQ